MIKAIKRKLFKIINRELNEIIKQQENPPKENSLFKDFGAVFAEKLKKHDEFMISIEKRRKSFYDEWEKWGKKKQK